nr:MAG TPA: Protein of unknown function (DUF1804) [Caudoviricetes sp.]
MASKASEEKKEFAFTLYMAGEQQNVIAEKVGVSKQTVNRWVAEGDWGKRRAAKNITRPELTNKLLLSIDKLLEKVIESDDADTFDGLGDKLSKLSAAVAKLDKGANVVDAVEVFMAFGKWMQQRAGMDQGLTAELLKTFNKYQDLYMAEQFSKG